MTLTHRTRPYETLIRHKADGSIAAHHQTIYELVDETGVVQSAIVNPVQAIDPAALPQVWGDAALPAALAELHAHRADHATQRHRAEDAEREVQGLRITHRRALANLHHEARESVLAHLSKTERATVLAREAQSSKAAVEAAAKAEAATAAAPIGDTAA